MDAITMNFTTTNFPVVMPHDSWTQDCPERARENSEAQAGNAAGIRRTPAAGNQSTTTDSGAASAKVTKRWILPTARLAVLGALLCVGF